MTKTKTKTNINEAWDQVMGQLKIQLPEHVYNRWVNGLEISSFDNNTIQILVDEEYKADWLNARLSGMITNYISTYVEGTPAIEFMIPDEDYNPAQPQGDDMGSRKAKLTQAYGENRSAIIKPQLIIYQTHYFFRKWRPILGRTSADVVLAARSLCYWNPITGEKRNLATTNRDELAELAGCSLRSVDNTFNNDLVFKYFIRKKIARVQTPEGPRNRGLILQVRMDDPLTPQDQQQYGLSENLNWVKAWPNELTWDQS